MKLATIAAALIAAYAAIPPAIAGPFGFDTASKQNPADLYSYCEDDQEGLFNITCTDAPRPHPEMGLYAISFANGVGLCAIRAITSLVSDNDYGSSTQRLVKTLAEQLTKKYGPWSDKNDLIFPDSIWDEPRYWMMSILKKDRLYGYSWDLNPPINGIDRIDVSAKAARTDKGIVLVEFLTPYEDKCVDAKDSAAADAF